MKVKDVYDEISKEASELYGYYLKYVVSNYSNSISEQDKQYITKQFEKVDGNLFPLKYQNWYTKCLFVLEIVARERKSEFIKQYEPDLKRKTVNSINYTIYDTLHGFYPSSSSPLASFNNLKMQISIVQSLNTIVENKIYNLKSLIEADVFESELESARYLLSKGFKRSAGAICGVLLEKHLSSMCENSNIAINKKDPTINDFNTELYKNGVIDSSQNKFLLYLSDIRNKCDHNKQSEPTEQEVDELLNGTKKVLFTY